MIINLFVILRRKVREGRLRVIRSSEYNDVKGMREESGVKKVDQFLRNLYVRERTLYLFLSFILNERF